MIAKESDIIDEQGALRRNRFYIVIEPTTPITYSVKAYDLTDDVHPDLYLLLRGLAEMSTGNPRGLVDLGRIAVKDDVIKDDNVVDLKSWKIINGSGKDRKH